MNFISFGLQYLSPKCSSEIYSNVYSTPQFRWSCFPHLVINSSTYNTKGYSLHEVCLDSRDSVSHKNNLVLFKLPLLGTWLFKGEKPHLNNKHLNNSVIFCVCFQMLYLYRNTPCLRSCFSFQDFSYLTQSSVRKQKIFLLTSFLSSESQQ